LILTLAISYALLTEVLQLFFTRDGRLFDVGFDAMGICMALGVGSFFIVRKVEKSI
jgi:VanZ family protein